MVMLLGHIPKAHASLSGREKNILRKLTRKCFSLTKLYSRRGREQVRARRNIETSEQRRSDKITGSPNYGVVWGVVTQDYKEMYGYFSDFKNHTIF